MTILFQFFKYTLCHLYNFTLIYTCPQPRIGAAAAVFSPPSFVLRVLYFVKCGKVERERERERERGGGGRDRGGGRGGERERTLWQLHF